MTRMRTIGAAMVLATGLTLAACDSQAENEVEDLAEAVDESYEAEAGLEEALAEGGPNEEAVDEYADQLRAEGEAEKDDLEDMADNLDDIPQ